MIDPYFALGVSPTATQGEITHAYRSQLRDYHPDMRSGEAISGADKRPQQILAAYRLLRDPQRRDEYDRSTARVRKTSAPSTITVTVGNSGDDDPPLRAGPVRWHR